MQDDSTRRNGYDSRTDTYRATHDWSAERPLGLTVVNAVAALEGRSPTDCAPLHDVIDPEALDDLFGPEGSEAPAEGCLRFEYLGHRVTVRDTGEVIVHDS